MKTMKIYFCNCKGSLAVKPKGICRRLALVISLNLTITSGIKCKWSYARIYRSCALIWIICSSGCPNDTSKNLRLFDLHLQKLQQINPKWSIQFQLFYFSFLIVKGKYMFPLCRNVQELEKEFPLLCH